MRKIFSINLTFQVEELVWRSQVTNIGSHNRLKNPDYETRAFLVFVPFVDPVSWFLQMAACLEWIKTNPFFFLLEKVALLLKQVQCDHRQRLNTQTRNKGPAFCDLFLTWTNMKEKARSSGSWPGVPKGQGRGPHRCATRKNGWTSNSADGKRETATTPAVASREKRRLSLLKWYSHRLE